MRKWIVGFACATRNIKCRIVVRFRFELFATLMASRADFTPSRGNTPVHQNLPAGSSLIDKTPFENRIPVSIPGPTPTPTEKKKKLHELFFQESFKDDEDADNEVKPPTAVKLPPKFVKGTDSVCSSERTISGDVLTEIETKKPFRTSQCCLPSLISCRSSSQKKKTSLTIAVGDKA